MRPACHPACPCSHVAARFDAVRRREMERHDNQGRPPEQVAANERTTGWLFVAGVVLVVAILVSAAINGGVR